MAIKYVCDCGCGKPIGDIDAAVVPNLYQDRSSGVLVEVRILRRTGPAPMIAPACVPEIVQRSERVFPVMPRVVDADADAPIPLPVPVAKTAGAR